MYIPLSIERSARSFEMNRRRSSRSSAAKAHRVSDVIIPMHIAVTLDRRQHVVGRLSTPRKKKTTLSAADYLLALSATTPRLSVTSDRALFHWRTNDTARGCTPGSRLHTALRTGIPRFSAGRVTSRGVADVPH